MKRALYLGFAVLVGLLSTESFAQDVVKAPAKPDVQEEGVRPRVRGAQRPGGERGGQQTEKAETAKPVPVAVEEGTAKLGPENSKVEFIGIHVGPEPKPRLGGFAKFSGSLSLSDDGTGIKSLNLEFETGSLWTELGGDLTSHLKNSDFLDVEKFPSAKFVSKSVKAGAKEGTLDVVGDFTLMEKTNEIIIPVAFIKSDEGVLVKGDLKLDRVVFGMNKMTDKVSQEVSIKLSIGEKTTGGKKVDAPVQGRGGPGRGGRSPDAMFKNQDKDADGKLTGDEIPDFLKSRMESFDENKDGSITLEELKKRMGGRGGRGGARPQGGNDQ